MTRRRLGKGETVRRTPPAFGTASEGSYRYLLPIDTSATFCPNSSSPRGIGGRVAPLGMGGASVNADDGGKHPEIVRSSNAWVGAPPGIWGIGQRRLWTTDLPGKGGCRGGMDDDNQ